MATGIALPRAVLTSALADIRQPVERVVSIGETERRQSWGLAMVMPDPKAVHYTRDRVAKNLRSWGFPQMAEQAERELPESFDGLELFAWAHAKGVDMDVLISHLGGGP